MEDFAGLIIDTLSEHTLYPKSIEDEYLDLFLDSMQGYLFIDHFTYNSPECDANRGTYILYLWAKYYIFVQLSTWMGAHKYLDSLIGLDDPSHELFTDLKAQLLVSKNAELNK
jgi:hypothetical protein